jgi:hypothetical protein
VQLKIDGTDLSAWADAIDFTPTDSDLGNQIATMRAVLQDKSSASCPKVPAWGLSADLIDDDHFTPLFGGRVFRVTEKSRPIKRRWEVTFQDHNARLFETTTGSLDKSGVVDSDRNFIIAILRDALKNQTFGVGTGLDDPIITANEPSWPGVKATTFMAGLDWSYMSPKNAFDNLTKYVPGTYLRIRPDKIVEYAPLGDTLAPFALHTAPDAVHQMYKVEVLADAPVAYWRLGETSGAVAADASGNGRDGTYAGGYTLGFAGAVDDADAATKFDGVTGRVSSPHVAAFNLGTAFSIECWYYMSSIPNAFVELVVKGITESAYFLRLGANAESNRVQGFIVVGGAAEPRVISSYVPAAGAWHHVVFTYDGSNLRLYVDGVLDGTTARTGTPDTNANALYVSSTFNPFPGRIDEVALYATTLSATRIAAHYAARTVIDLVGVEGWEETEEMTDHRNKLRRGGAGASTATATDEVSYARIGRILEDPYKNDTSVPAGELVKRTYAELKTRAVRRLAKGRIYVTGAKAGQAIDVVNTRIGTIENIAPYPEVFGLAAPSKTAKLSEGYRGRFIIQKVTTAPLGNGRFAYDLALGSYQRDLTAALSVLARKVG